MAIDGNYNIEIETPFGPLPGKLELKVDKNDVTGSCSTRMGTQALKGNLVSEQEIFCTTRVDTPIGKLDLKITGKVNGDEISGQAKAGIYGSFAFKGKKD